MGKNSSFDIDIIGNKIWTNRKGIYHRLDGPAIIKLDGTKIWYKNGLRHRLNGPAVEVVSYKDWWKNGIKFPDKNTFFESLTEKEKETVLFSTNFFID